MLTRTEIRKGAKIIIENEPYEVLEAMPLKKAQRRVVIQTRIRNLLTGNVLVKNFHQSEVFEEADISKMEVKFLYSHRDQYFFCEKKDPSKRFSFTSEQIGEQAKFFKANQLLEAIVFQGKILNVVLPIKISLKVVEAPPGVKGERAVSGTKMVTLENGVQINVPLFVEEGDIVEINTQTNEYVRRV